MKRISNPLVVLTMAVLLSACDRGKNTAMETARTGESELEYSTDHLPDKK